MRLHSIKVDKKNPQATPAEPYYKVTFWYGRSKVSISINGKSISKYITQILNTSRNETMLVKSFEQKQKE